MQAQKKIAQTDEIFSYVHTANRIADETEGVLRAAYGQNVTWERKDFEHYAVWLFRTGPPEGTPPRLWWSGVMPLRM